MPYIAARSCRLVEGHGYRDSGSRLEMWTCILLLSGDPANNCLETFQVPATHAALWQLLFIVICVVCLFRTNSYETLVYKASQSALRNLNAKLRALYNLGASLIAWLANPFSGGPYWCHFPSGFAEWAVSIYAILTVWCIMAGFWLHLRERSACSFKHTKRLLGVHNRGAAAASEAGQEPSPAASADSASVGDASAMPETQASIESPSSGNRTSSAAGADKTMLTGTGVVPGVPVSSGKAKPKTAQAGIRATVEVKQAPGTPTAGGGSNSNKAHHSNQAGHSSSEPQQGNSVAGSPVPAVPALPAAHAVPVEATPAVQSPPADAGDAAGGLVQTAREERRKEKKRVNRQKAAAAKKAAAELAAAGIITASSADQPGQASASNPAEPAVPAEPMAPAEPADGGNTAGRCFLTAQQQRLMADLLSSEPQQGNSAAGPPVPAMPAAHAVPAEATPAVPQSPPAAAGDVAGGLVQTAREARRKEQKRVNRQKAAAAKKAAADLAAAGSITASSADQPGQAGAFNPAPRSDAADHAEPAAPAPFEPAPAAEPADHAEPAAPAPFEPAPAAEPADHAEPAAPAPFEPASAAEPAALASAEPAHAGNVTEGCALTARQQRIQEKKRMNRQKAAARKAAADLAAAGSITASSADQPGQANGFGGSTVNFTGSVEAAHHDFGADSQKASHQGSLQPDSQKATRQGSIQPGSQGVSAAAASQEVLTAAPKSKMTGPARSSLAQKQLKPGVNSFKLKVPAIKSPDDTGPAANANRSSVPAVQAGADASTKQQQSVTRKKDRVAAPGSSHRRQPGGGSKGRAPAAKRGALLPGPSHQQHPSAGNRSSVSDVSKAAPQHTTAAPPAEHSQSKAGVQSSHAHARSKAHSVARPAAQKQPPTAAWKTRSQSAAQRPTSNTALLSSGDPTSNPQPPQPGQGPSGPMSYAKAAGKGLPQKQHTLLVRDRVPMDSLVVPYLSRERDSAEEQQAKKQVYDSLMELATGQHQIRSCRHIAGDGNCGYRAVMVGLIEGAYASATFKRWLLASLPKGLGGIRRFGFAKGGRGAQDCPINQGFHQLMALVENTNNLSLDSLIGECRLEQAADCKLLFIRAAMAAGLMQSEQALWPQIQAAVEGADKR
ncbi:TPA: hypothetical protein ACH3X2_002297 [Trebouxia sp. C0005]